MDRYVPRDITLPAKKEAENFPMLMGPEGKAGRPVFSRCPRANNVLRKDSRIKMKTMGKESVQINRETIDLRYVEQIVDSEQVSALGYCVRYAEKHLLDGKKNLQKIAEEPEEKIRRDGLAAICESNSNIANLALPRRQEIHACLNRYRGLKL
ncbi:ABC transporter, ATPase [Clostridium saccharoperbutylacetonicum N1-4(HMT)] [Clostridioides difficile]|nr:ABC transporter, ATPase [Clostridium saccharoperbutylacetonicum N1-4(HMT)] [Clostridioides difficile]